MPKELMWEPVLHWVEVESGSDLLKPSSDISHLDTHKNRVGGRGDAMMAG